MTPVVIGASATDARVTTLMEAQQTELTGRYDDASLTEPFDPGSSSGAGNVLLTVQGDLGLIACGALKRWDAITAEIKRMYTLPEVRGQGHARRGLVGLIERGCAQGYSRLMLEWRPATASQRSSPLMDGWASPVSRTSAMTRAPTSACVSSWCCPPT
ncbi:GNAT family N-acetyltransferase [Deinococcus sp.]|uniref:GNAT family N-acetyltransferase n=1 Tax=Deinococcus sp. TaxID=47478 RepID=UPI002869C872|nr:GNAT family N-acetyltransferase [Deinococcus sp.]